MKTQCLSGRREKVFSDQVFCCHLPEICVSIYGSRVLLNMKKTAVQRQEDKNMTENMMDIGDIEFGAELTLNEMNEISGGAFKKPAAKTGYTIYQIQAHDTLIRIANKFGIKSYKEILKWNPKITNPRLIRTGDYIYIKK